MINSRRIEDLHPHVQLIACQFIEDCKAQGIDLLITSTYRDAESQAVLYAQGRTVPGSIVTNAKPGQSFHQYRVAMDVVPLRYSKPVWSSSGPDHKLWESVGRIGKRLGFEWGEEWKAFAEMPHFQITGGLKLADFQRGKTLNIS
jgi:peptidoglycan LD-endopeptidase CwlK